MPIYMFKCVECEKSQEEIHKIENIPDLMPCHSCGGEAKRTLSQVSVQLKGYGFPGRDMKEKKYRTGRHAEMGRRQRESHAVSSKVTPNVGGELCDSWSDAAKLAKEKGKDAASYERKAAETT